MPTVTRCTRQGRVRTGRNGGGGSEGVGGKGDWGGLGGRRAPQSCRNLYSHWPLSSSGVPSHSLFTELTSLQLCVLPPWGYATLLSFPSRSRLALSQVCTPTGAGMCSHGEGAIPQVLVLTANRGNSLANSFTLQSGSLYTSACYQTGYDYLIFQQH